MGEEKEGQGRSGGWGLEWLGSPAMTGKGRKGGEGSRFPSNIRHGRACPGHPRPVLYRTTTWMPATSAGMTKAENPPMQTPRDILADLWNLAGGAPSGLDTGTLHGPQLHPPSSLRLAAPPHAS